jgi:cytochrome P450
MTDTAGIDFATVDPFDPAFKSDPYPLYKRLREESPVYRAPGAAEVVLTRYDDCINVLRDPRFSANPANLNEQAAAQVQSPVYQPDIPIMLFIDPPDHTRLRSLVSQAFTPRTIERRRARVRELVDELLEPVLDRGRIDVLRDLAYPLPVTVICEVMGVPVDDRDQFHELSSSASRLLDGNLDEETTMRGLTGAMQIIMYFTGLVDERRKAPRDDLLSALVAAEEAGDRLTHEELMATATLLFIAGHETTMNLIGNGTLALLRNPDQLRRLQDDPSLVPTAVEEFLRYDGPVHVTTRIATEPLEIGGVALAKGESATPLLAAANRDPARFERPDELDVGRTENRHLAFSHGAHFCLGAALARLEGQEVFSAMIERMGDWELVTAEPRYRGHFVLRGLEELEVAFRAR